MNNENVKIGDADFSGIAEGHIRFNIKALDTEENKSVHNAFKEFCKVETDNNYTLGLRKLLEYYQGDFKYEMLLDKIQEQGVVLADLRASIVELQSKPKTEEKGKTAF